MSREDLAAQAQDPERFERMVKLLSEAQTKSELETLAVLYIGDMSYKRHDIALALKVVELDKGW